MMDTLSLIFNLRVKKPYHHAKSIVLHVRHVHNAILKKSDSPTNMLSNERMFVEYMQFDSLPPPPGPLRDGERHQVVLLDAGLDGLQDQGRGFMDEGPRRGGTEPGRFAKRGPYPFSFIVKHGLFDDKDVYILYMELYERKLE